MADGRPYELLVEAGDVLLAHPWLAHGIGGNRSGQTRVAMYTRLSNYNFYNKSRTQMAGTDLKLPESGEILETDIWNGDYFANVPQINSWLHSHGQTLRDYDQGRLEQALAMLNGHHDHQ